MALQSLDFSTLSPLAFIMVIAWYLLSKIQPEMKEMSKKQDQQMILLFEMQKQFAAGMELMRQQNESSSAINKELFKNIEEIISDSMELVRTTNESVKIHNELTKATLNRLDRLEASKDDKAKT